MMQVPGKAGTDTDRSSEMERPELFCVPCYRDDASGEEAVGYCQNCEEHLCQSCFKTHRKHKLSINHILLNKKTMPNIMTPKWRPSSDACRKPCPNHTDKVIEFYCCQHENVFCYVCSTLDHNLCSKMYIPKIAEAYMKKKEFKAKLQRLTALKQGCHRITEKIKSELFVAELSLDNVVEIFMERKAAISKALERQEKEIRQTTEEIRQRTRGRAEAIIKPCEKLCSRLIRMETENGNVDKGNGNKMGIFINTIQIQDQLDECEDLIRDMENEVIKTRAEFIPNQAVSEMAKSKYFIGKLTTTNDTVLAPLSYDIDDNGIYVNTSEDKRICWITGMSFVSDTTIAIADFNNKAIKMVDTRSHKITKRLQLTTCPFDLTTLPDHTLAVTLCNASSIQLISTIGGLRTFNTIKCALCPHGIQYHQGKFIVSFLQPDHKIQVLSLTGDVIRTVVSGLRFPHYVTVNNDNDILVSDSDNNRVLKLDQAGNVIGTYTHTDLMWPRGVAVCADGSTIVCSHDTDTVHLVSRNFTVVKTLLDETCDIDTPFACLYSEYKSLFYLSMRSRTERDNILQVFQI